MLSSSTPSAGFGVEASGPSGPGSEEVPRALSECGSECEAAGLGQTDHREIELTPFLGKLIRPDLLAELA